MFRIKLKIVRGKKNVSGEVKKPQASTMDLPSLK